MPGVGLSAATVPSSALSWVTVVAEATTLRNCCALSLAIASARCSFVTSGSFTLPLHTVSVTLVPSGTWAPNGGGFCEVTQSATWQVPGTSTVWTTPTRCAACSFASASLASRPVTGGIEVIASVYTDSVTRTLALICWLAGGSIVQTVFCGTALTHLLTSVTGGPCVTLVKPLLCSMLSAELSDSPATSGTVSVAGPLPDFLVSTINAT